MVNGYYILPGTDLNEISEVGKFMLVDIKDNHVQKTSTFYSTLGDIYKFKESGDFTVYIKNESGEIIDRKFSDVVKDLGLSM